jgi:acyl-CoA hydrolase
MSLDLSELIRPGDRIVWGQTCGEPRTLLEMLAAQRHRLAGVRCFLGIPAADPVLTTDQADALTFESYCGTGTNAALHDAGVLQIVPVHYSTLPERLAGGSLAVDVVFVQVSAADEQGHHSLGLDDDYFSAALDTARVVIAEVNDQVPFTLGARTLTSADWTAAIATSRPPAELPTPRTDATACAVAAQVASLVPDGATLQFGIGTLPEACLDALHEHRDLGIHSGLINDAAMRLVDAGVATGECKTSDRGVAVGGMLGGTQQLFRWADRNPKVHLRSTGYTHDPAVLAAQHQLVAINSAIEVDLSGQVNAEVARGRYVGAVGGATDFLRGAAASRGGVPVIALPSTAGAHSRIVVTLSGPTSVSRSDVGVIVTEFGAADLRGLSVPQRFERMLAIAHPAHRPALEAELEEKLMSGAAT